MCEDDGNMLGLGAGSPWAMLWVWAKAATHHGRLIFLANGAQWLKNVSYVRRYVGLVQNRRKKMSRRTIGVNLVQTIF
jgi:hypothetical protein